MKLTDIILYYTLGIIALSGLAYLLARLRDRRLNWELSRPRLARCPACNRVFLVKRFAPVPHCPRCNTVSSLYVTN